MDHPFRQLETYFDGTVKLCAPPKSQTAVEIYDELCGHTNIVFGKKRFQREAAAPPTVRARKRKSTEMQEGEGTEEAGIAQLPRGWNKISIFFGCLTGSI